MLTRKDAGEQASEEQEVQAESGGWTGILAAAGLVALAGGGLLAAAPRLSPKLDWVATRFGELGIASGVVIACGVLCLGLAMVAQSLTQVRRQAREFGAAARDLRDLFRGIKRLDDRIGRIQMEISVLQEANKTLLKAAQDQTAVQAAGHQVDASYRLAASLDQLGLRLEQRLSNQQADLRAAIDQISGTVATTRRQLESWIESEVSGSLGEDLDGCDFDVPPLVLEGPESFGEQGAWNPEALAELPELDDDEELEVLVTLEDLDLEEEEEEEIVFDLEQDFLREASQLEERPPGAESTPEVIPEVTPEVVPEGTLEEVLEGGLGLLDILDDEGAPRPREEVDRVTPPTATPVEQPAGPAPTPEPPSILPDPERARAPEPEDAEPESDDEDFTELLSDEALQEALDNLKHRHDR